MKYLNFLYRIIKKCIKNTFAISIPFLFTGLLIFACFALDEDSEFNINPNDYCNLTDVDYTAVLHDDPNGKANVEITEYLTFDVHASSRSNTFKELWRELPEETVDGLKVTYNVKSVTQILENGEEIPYKETSKMYWEDEDYTQSATKYWHHSKGSGVYPDDDESLLIYIPWTYREKMKFKIVYSMNNAALKYKDCSELYLSLYSGNTITKLNSYKAKILIPNNLMPSEYHTYSYGTKNDRIPYTESSTENLGYHTFSINLSKEDLKFNYHNRYIEFCLISYGEDKHIFTKYAPKNKHSTENVLEKLIKEDEYYQSKNEFYKKYKMYFLIIAMVGSVGIVYNAIRKYNNIKKKYSFYEPETDYEFFREIPSDLDPIFASELVFYKDPFDENAEKQEEYAAVLLSLVRKKYVKIEKNDPFKDWNESNTIISIESTQTEYVAPEASSESQEPVYEEINENTGVKLEPLTTSERLYLELLERYARTYSNRISLKTFQERINMDYERINSFVKDIETKPALECGVMQGYFQETKYDEPKKLLTKSANISLAFGFIFLIAFNFISYFTPLAFCYGAYTLLGIACLARYTYLISKSCNLLLFTQYGANEQAKWCGLYNFLKSDTLINEKEVHDLVLWEKYLIYATAFGISEKVVKAIKLKAIQIDTSPILNSHCYIHSSSFHSISRSFGHSIHTSSRGGFSGHGYGGGGRGGGGGGRRPLIEIKKKNILLFFFFYYIF